MSAPAEPTNPTPAKPAVSETTAALPTSATSRPPATANETKPVSALTPEEQMALFEQDLKENDWGHQPC
jgi:hypothetical protein